MITRPMLPAPRALSDIRKLDISDGLQVHARTRLGFQQLHQPGETKSYFGQRVSRSQTKPDGVRGMIASDREGIRSDDTYALAKRGCGKRIHPPDPTVEGVGVNTAAY